MQARMLVVWVQNIDNQYLKSLERVEKMHVEIWKKQEARRNHVYRRELDRQSI